MRLEKPQKVPGNEFFPEWNESGTLRGITSIPYPTFGLSDVANTGGSAGTRTQGHLIKSPMSANIHNSQQTFTTVISMI